MAPNPSNSSNLEQLAVKGLNVCLNPPLVIVVVYAMLQQSLPHHPQSRVTFGGTQLRSCSISSGSGRSSTSGSGCSRHHNDVFPTGRSFEATQTCSSLLSEVEDLEGPCFQPNRLRGDMDPDMIGRRKKAKIGEDTCARGEVPFVHVAAKPSQSFASLEHSLTETDADEYHFWSKVSSPQHEYSFVRLEEDDIESPLSLTDEDRSSCLRSSFVKTCDDPTLSWQASSSRNSCTRGSNKEYFQRPGDVHHKVFGEGTSVSKQRVATSSLQSSIHHRECATDLRSVTSDAEGGRSETVDKAESAARSNKWLAFVHGIWPTSELSPPG